MDDTDPTAAKELAFFTDPDRLPPLQWRFCQEYVLDLNGTQAAIRAGFARGGAASKASELLKTPGVREAVAMLKAERAVRTQVTADRVLHELARIAFADARPALAWAKAQLTGSGGGRGAAEVLEPEGGGLDEDTSAAIADIWQTAAGVRVRMHDKLGALRLLARHLGLVDLGRKEIDPRLREEIEEAAFEQGYLCGEEMAIEELALGDDDDDGAPARAPASPA